MSYCQFEIQILKNCYHLYRHSKQMCHDVGRAITPLSIFSMLNHVRRFTVNKLIYTFVSTFVNQSMARTQECVASPCQNQTLYICMRISLLVLRFLLHFLKGFSP